MKALDITDRAQPITNAATLRINSKAGGFIGTIRTSNSRKLYDVLVRKVDNVLVADLTEVGTKDYTRILLNTQKGGVSPRTGGKMPNLTSEKGILSIAIWFSDYDNLSMFAIVTDIEEAATSLADDILSIAHDCDDKQDLAQSFHDAAQGQAGRPDLGNDAEREALAHCQSLNG